MKSLSMLVQYTFILISTCILVPNISQKLIYENNCLIPSIKKKHNIYQFQ
jgi:hypothetical protein